jgi:hypothetical protein
VNGRAFLMRTAVDAMALTAHAMTSNYPETCKDRLAVSVVLS